MHAVIKFIAYAWFQYVCHTKWCDVMWRRPLNKPLIILNGSIQLRSKWIWNTLQNKKIRTRNCPNQLNYVTLDSTISQLVQVQLPLWINYIWVNSKWMNNFFLMIIALWIWLKKNVVRLLSIEVGGWPKKFSP